jgi:AGCS family alanine or glycine:cation symporter
VGKRIAKFTEFVVPIMAIIYIVIVLVIIVIDIDQLPGVIALVLKVLLTWKLVLEPFWFSSSMGCKRGIYSNEAGQGTAPHIAAAANVSHPTKQGLVQSFSVYIDTLLVCSATGFMLLITGKYNVQNPVLGADGATQFYTKEQKMFLLVPDLHNLQWIAFFLVLVLTL